MNLQTTIPDILWLAIADAYQAENYSHAILNAIHCVSSILRERAGIDGDGAALAGMALGGESPKLKLNALQTESDKNVQKGIEHILRGIYIGIRNPRSHGQTTDDKSTADSIIAFLGYIARLLNASKESFSAESFMARVVDADFVQSERYAELLVQEIPQLRITDAIVQIFRNRRRIELRKRRSLIHRLFAEMNEAQMSSYLTVVSEELATVSDEQAIRTALQMLTPEIWPSLSEIARLRIESRLVGCLRQGEWRPDGKTIQPLGTWSNNFLKSFTTRAEAADVLIAKLASIDADERAYVARFFFGVITEVMTTPSETTRCIRAIVFAVNEDDENVRSALIRWISSFPPEWQSELVESLKAKTDENDPAVYLDDGTPFLSAPSKDVFNDDIPF